MSAGTLPYHLRQNKAVDRAVFIDMLMRIHTYISVRDHAYVSLGGPFLEDFRIIHAALGIRRMISLNLTNKSIVDS